MILNEKIHQSNLGDSFFQKDGAFSVILFLIVSKEYTGWPPLQPRRQFLFVFVEQQTAYLENYDPCYRLQKNDLKELQLFLRPFRRAVLKDF